MSDNRYLIIHKDHPLDVHGVNAGAGMATLSLAKALAAEGVEVSVAGQLTHDDCEKDGVKYWNLGRTFDVEIAFERMREGGQYHLISAGRAFPLLAAKKDGKCLSKSLICHDPSGTATGVSNEILCENVDHIICVSNAQKKLFIEAGADAQKITVIYNGADLEKFTAGEASQRDFHRIIFVGALVADKGIQHFLNTYAQLKSKHHNLRFDVYGSAALWDREPLFDEREVERQIPGIKFHGSVTQDVVAQAYREAALCVMPSIWFDSFPLTAVEAQVSGCPVVAFPVGGISEAIESGVTGVITPAVDFEQLREVLDSLLSSHDKLMELSENAARISRERFDWRKTARQIKDLVGNHTESNKVVKKGKIGFLSTWNQNCGIAMFAGYALKAYQPGTFVVLAEDTADTCGEDQDFVLRCWKKDSSDFSGIARAIADHNIELLHLNLHNPTVLPQPDFASFLNELRNQGVKIVAQMHTTFTLDPNLIALLQAVDKVIVHTDQNRLQAIANGAIAENVAVIPLGANGFPEESLRTNAREELGINGDEKIVLSFGFVQPHKGMEALINGIAALRKAQNVKGFIVGAPNPSDPGSDEYLSQLKEHARVKGVSEQINFVTEFVSEDLLEKYIQASDLVVMNYHSQYYEFSAACLKALEQRAVVATSLAPSFRPFGDAVWHLTAGYPIEISLELLLTNQELRKTLLKNSEEYCKRWSWQRVAQEAHQIYLELGVLPVTSPRQKIEVSSEVLIKSPQKRSMRVLMQSRPSAESHPGGDTVLMNQIKESLQRRGVEVTVDLEGRESASDYDIVHLYNFATPEYTQILAERAYEQGVPYVVSTLYEDIPSFLNQANYYASHLIDYVRRDQDRAWHLQNKPLYHKIPQCGRFENTWTATHAASLFVTGKREAECLKRDYPTIKSIEEIKLGYEVSESADPNLFINEYGVKDFVLCVGRLEARKNQLMLLKALEDIDIPVVIAAGGFSYQPEYEQAVRNFRRRGKTIVLGRLSSQMLASAYAAAKVHALPSWYELPGLVSLEAAYHGCNVVVSNSGTIFDYLGEKAFYCNPEDEDSIRQAVLAAYQSPVLEGLKEVVMDNTWDSVGKKTLEAYKKVVGAEIDQLADQNDRARAEVQTYDMDTRLTDFQDLLEQGELATKHRKLEQAELLLKKAELINPSSVRLLRALGALYLSQSNTKDAQIYFERAIVHGPTDARALIGRGMCDALNKNYEQAYGFFVRALQIDPYEHIALHQLIECSFALDRYADLQISLENFVKHKPNDLEMRFCLAGCYYKTNNIDQAKSQARHIMQIEPNHIGAKQLLEKIEEEEKIEDAQITETFEIQQIQTPQAKAEPKETEMFGLVPSEETEIAETGLSFNAPQAFAQNQISQSIDVVLSELDEEKRKRNVNKVKQGCEEILQRSDLSLDQMNLARVLQAETLILEGEIDSASEIYTEVLEKDPNFPRAICGRAALAAHNGRWAEAKSLFEKSLRINPRFDIALAGMGMCSAQEQDFDKAWNYYTQALSINPENMRALLGILEIGYPLGRLVEIENVIQAFLELHPVDTNMIYSLAGCMFAQERFEEAIEELEKILLFEPDNHNALELKEVIFDRIQGVGVRAPIA